MTQTHILPCSDHINRQILLARTPVGALVTGDFTMTESPVAAIGDGQILVHNLMLSLDPAVRGWMRPTTYRAQIKPGNVVHGFTIGRVAESRSPRFAVGELVECLGGWQDYAITTADELVRRDPEHSLEELIGVFGIAGATAYHGLFDICRPRAGDVVLISAAAGAVGSIVGQLARLAGCHVIGIAGGSDKCDWIKREFGFDAAVDYKAPDFLEALRAVCSAGIDIYFDNVGGSILETALGHINIGARICCCGSVSSYDGIDAPFVSQLLPSVITTKRARMEGFVVLDYTARRNEADKRLGRWLKTGQLKASIDIKDGLENAPAAFIALLAGNTRGKAAVRLT